MFAPLLCPPVPWRSCSLQAGHRVHTNIAFAQKAALIICVAALTTAAAAPGFGKDRTADAHLRAIYTAEWKWRLGQVPGQEDSTTPIGHHPPHGGAPAP